MTLTVSRAFKVMTEKAAVLSAAKKKAVLTLLLLLTLSSMLFSWFGGARGVQEIRGTVVLLHPATLVCAAVLLLEIWRPLPATKGIPGILAALGIMGTELYFFLFWHYETISGRLSLSYSFRTGYPAFYLGFGLTALLLIAFLLWRRQPECIPQKQQDGPSPRPL